MSTLIPADLPFGLLSFGHALFFGWASYISAHAAKVWGISPELAILEMERCMKELGMSGIQIGSHVNDWNLDHPSLFPFFLFGLPIDLLHSLIIGPQLFYPGSHFLVVHELVARGFQIAATTFHKLNKAFFTFDRGFDGFHTHLDPAGRHYQLLVQLQRAVRSHCG